MSHSRGKADSWEICGYAEAGFYRQSRNGSQMHILSPDTDLMGCPDCGSSGSLNEETQVLKEFEATTSISGSVLICNAFQQCYNRLRSPSPSMYSSLILDFLAFTISFRTLPWLWDFIRAAQNKTETISTFQSIFSESNTVLKT